MDLDTTGERLVFGSATGSLWPSKNGGDSWQTISQHLPPTYCARFARTNHENVQVRLRRTFVGQNVRHSRSYMSSG